MNKCIILANGKAPKKEVIKYLRSIGYNKLICADGGANSAFKMELTPDFIIGDLDSARSDVLNYFRGKSEIISISRQNDTDVEKCLKFAIKHGYSEAVLTGVTGDRLDHTFGNLGIVIKFHHRLKIKIIAENSVLEPFTGYNELKTVPGETVSVYGLDTDTKILSKGLKYKINNIPLPFGQKESTSNIALNVSTWYGGILGVGEFTYKYGLLSWFTQGLPYYIFAILFALLFAEKIRSASLFTIPDKIKKEYGSTAGLIAAVIVFILVSPAPYLLMTANLISIVFGINIIWSLILSLLLSLLYLIKGGFRSDVYTDAVQFFVMFAGFIVIVVFAVTFAGGYGFLKSNLPEGHLNLTGGSSPFYVIVWFLIALWTFADPGFHQRCYAAKTGSTAKWGIIISVFLWSVFDFLTTTTGLYSRAVLGEISNPVLSFPLLAEKILGQGYKGLFYAALFATIMSTLNSFLFLSASTIGRDFLFNFSGVKNENRLKYFTIIGLAVSGILGIGIAYTIPSVIEIWYTIGSVFIPGIIFAVISSYYSRWKINSSVLLWEMIISVLAAGSWIHIRKFSGEVLGDVEPMIIGLVCAVIIHFYGLIKKEAGSNGNQPLLRK